MRDVFLRHVARMLKVVMNFLQVICSIDTVYSISLPAEALAFLRHLKFFNFDLTKLFRLGCLKRLSYMEGLLLILACTFTMLVLDACIYLLQYKQRKFEVKRLERHGSKRRLKSLILRAQSNIFQDDDELRARIASGFIKLSFRDPKAEG